jgi:acyl-coenzyme A thioesterase PaaI-like protein
MTLSVPLTPARGFLHWGVIAALADNAMGWFSCVAWTAPAPGIDVP